MNIYTSWLKRKKTGLCLLAGICAISLFVIINSDEKLNQITGGSYVIKIKHYGIDAAEMERSVTIPLEDAFFSISGVMSVLSSSENSLSRVFVRFKPGTHGRYEAVRDAAQRVYETLPSSAQRPEILSSSNSMIPVWSAAVIIDDSYSNDEKENILIAQKLENIVKPRFESLDGAGEVIVSGIGIKEIYLILDQEKLSILGLQPSMIASVLAMNDSIFSGGTITQQNRELIITVDGRYDQNSSLNKTLIPLGNGKYIELSEIALIIEQERDPEILSRLNGKKTASIAIMGRHGADLRKLSSDVKKELSALSLPLEFVVLSDLGAEEASAFRSVFYAALMGAIMVAIISFLLNKGNKAGSSGFFCALAVPLICLISAAILSIFGFSLDRLLLAGIAAGICTAVDAVILCSEKLRKCYNYNSASEAIISLAGPLLAGAATTVVALIPLMLIETDNVKIIAISIAVVTITAFVLSLSLLPPLLLWRLSSNKTKIVFFTPIFLGNIEKKLSKQMCKFLAAVVRFSCRYPILVITISFVVTISAVFLLLAKGMDTSSYGSEDSVYAQVEFEGGLLAEEVDRHLLSFSNQLAINTGIKNIETGARIGSGSLLISFDPKKIKTHQVRDLAKQINIPGGFVFFQENTKKDRYWEIFIYGDEDQKCRELAELLAYYCGDHPLIRERVLNFKQGSKKLIFLPDREKFAELKMSFSTVGDLARMGVYGPVTYKRISITNNDSNRETDVRIRTGNIEDINNFAMLNAVKRQTREGALGIIISNSNEDSFSSLRLDSFTEIKEDTEPSSIRRDNRRRYASITVSTKPMDPRRVKKELSPILSRIDLPPGYSIEFDPNAIRQSESLSLTVLSLIMAIILCYMIIAAINESFTNPLLVLSAIPPSLAISAICLVLLGSTYNSAIACAFIAVSGMTVNAAVLCVDSIRSALRKRKEKTILTIYLALREKMPALLATTGTTVAGGIPFFFLTEGANTLIRTLSLVGVIGVTGSLLCSITIIPSLLSLSKNIFKL
jgi:multidrug efflux pump subunit AcrB